MGFSKLFFCSFIFIVCISNLSIHSVAYVSINKITLLGDAYFQENGRICLTPYSPSPSPSPSSSIGVGRDVYNHPIRFLDPSTNSNASFICSFSFYITPFSDSSSSPPLFRDGLTFIITSKKYILGSGFGYMGLSNETSQEEGGVYIAVEFDTSFDLRIDINSVMSFASVDSTSMGFDLKNGKRMTVWIEYIDSKKMVEVWLRNTKSRTNGPILATHIDLSMYLEEFMFIGFSASNGKGSTQHVVEKRRFRTYGFLPSTNSFDTRVEDGCFMCVTDDVVKNGSAGSPSNEIAFLVLVLVVIWGISWFFTREKPTGDTGNEICQIDDTDSNPVPERPSSDEIELPTGRVHREGRGTAYLHRYKKSKSKQSSKIVVDLQNSVDWCNKEVKDAQIALMKCQIQIRAIKAIEKIRTLKKQLKDNSELLEETIESLKSGDVRKRDKKHLARKASSLRADICLKNSEIENAESIAAKSETLDLDDLLKKPDQVVSSLFSEEKAKEKKASRTAPAATF
ncbi:hypothetical protein MKW92_030623 [Papaver armeniacum]|nr:hypothetical protein MKW92_030623 [Papaver armeniacum]